VLRSPSANSTAINRLPIFASPSSRHPFLRCLRNVLSAIPRARQNSLRLNPLALNSSTNRLISWLLRRFRPCTTWFLFIKLVEHKNPSDD